MVTNITDKLFQRLISGKAARSPTFYPIIFINAVHLSVRNNSIIKKLAAYIIFCINEEGLKEVLSIQVGAYESSKYWLSVLNLLKPRCIGYAYSI